MMKTKKELKLLKKIKKLEMKIIKKEIKLKELRDGNNIPNN